MLFFPLLLMKSDDEGETYMIICSAFLGMNVDKEKDNLATPEIAWFVKTKSDDRQDNPFPFDD